MLYSKDCIKYWLSTTAAAATTASTATAAPETIGASETVETIKTVKAVETEEEKAAKATAKTKTADLPGLITIILALIPRNRLVRMEITNIQHLKISLKIIHVHTSVNSNKLSPTKGNLEEQQKSNEISLNSSILRILSSSKYVPGWGIVTESNTQIY
ncbi:hypothetical protein [Cytobacillus oceanisediminis]|uniref:hypothetical protein n=1 Tax=Cytobacillus oceanisediminis TaxID=665099 RepID=UPI003D7DAA61